MLRIEWSRPATVWGHKGAYLEEAVFEARSNTRRQQLVEEFLLQQLVTTTTRPRFEAAVTEIIRTLVILQTPQMSRLSERRAVATRSQQGAYNPVATARGSDRAVAFIQDETQQSVLSCFPEDNFMHTSRAVIAIVVLVLISFSVFARPQAIVTDLTGLAWMAGNWSGAQGGVETEEFWQEPRGNIMLGLHRDVAGGRTVSFEFLRIEATPEAITYWASPRGRPATPFRLIEQKEKRVVFENPKHDFPQRVIYWLGEDGALHAKIEGTLNGKPAAEEWTWRRATRN